MKFIVIFLLILQLSVTGFSQNANHTGIYEITTASKPRPNLTIKQRGSQMHFYLENYSGADGARIGSAEGEIAQNSNRYFYSENGDTLFFHFLPSGIDITVKKRDNSMFPGFESTYVDPNGFYEKISSKVSDFDADDSKSSSSDDVKSAVAISMGLNNPPKEQVYSFVEQSPSFPGGQQSLNRYLSTNMRYPKVAKTNGVRGTVFTQFIVHADGSISDVKTVGAMKGAGLEEEAVRLVQSMPRWVPGKQGGESVSVQFNLPIRFELK